MEQVQQLGILVARSKKCWGYSPGKRWRRGPHGSRPALLERRGQPHAVDQPKYPIQTLVDGGGDCEDFSILTASILWSLGHPVALLYLETEATAHMAVGYQTDELPGCFAVNGPDDQRYVYIEAAPTEAAGLADPTRCCADYEAWSRFRSEVSVGQQEGTDMKIMVRGLFVAALLLANPVVPAPAEDLGRAVSNAWVRVREEGQAAASLIWAHQGGLCRSKGYSRAPDPSSAQGRRCSTGRICTQS